MNLRPLATLISCVPILLLTSGQAAPSAEPAPPENLSVSTTTMTLGRDIGYVTGVGFFTEAQVKDADWEFRRVQQAEWHYCPAQTRFVHRDIRWVPKPDAPGGRCAMLIYSMRCVTQDDIEAGTARVVPLPLAQARAALLDGPMDMQPDGAQCGERDADVRARLRRSQN